MGVAQRHELYRYARFNSEVDSATWDESENKWKIRIQIAAGKESEYQSDYTITSDFLASAVGQLNTPNTPQFSGLEDYHGRIMHSARWDWSTPIAGRRVCVIGTGEYISEVSRLQTSEGLALIDIFTRPPRGSHVGSWELSCWLENVLRL